MFTKVDGPVRLADRVASMLADEIESGRLTTGDKLPTEVELVKQLGVSRTVIREAVSRLSNAGLVEARQGRGVFVLPRRTRPLDLEADTTGTTDTKAKVLQIVEVRRAMEGEAAEIAATRATAADHARMRQALAAIDAAVAAGGDGADEDLAFHRSIAESTGNAVMVSTVRYLGEVSAAASASPAPTRPAGATSSTRSARNTRPSWPPSSRATPRRPARPPAATSNTRRPGSKRRAPSSGTRRRTWA